jgi:hypothetical protein
MLNYIKNLFAIKVRSQREFFPALWEAEKRKWLPKTVKICAPVKIYDLWLGQSIPKEIRVLNIRKWAITG